MGRKTNKLYTTSKGKGPPEAYPSPSWDFCVGRAADAARPTQKICLKRLGLQALFDFIYPLYIFAAKHPALQKAVGQQTRYILLRFLDQIFDNQIVLQWSDEAFIEVEMTTLDEIAHELGLQKVNTVKIAVEGAEGLVLRGAEQILSRFRPLLIVEFDRSREEIWGDSPEAILVYLEQWGYVFYGAVEYANVITIPRVRA